MYSPLILVGNQAGDDGAKAFATHALAPDATALETVHLGDNNIGEEGGQALAAAFPGNMTVTGMDVDGNKIGDEATQAIFTAMGVNKFGF